MKRIVIGVDGSEAAATAARWGAGLAAAAGADVVVATSFASQLGVPRQDRLPILDELTDRFTEEWCRPVREVGVEFESVVLDQLEVVPGLEWCAEDRDADLLVVGSRGSGGFAGLRLGSVADHLAHTTARPLAVVPADVHPAVPTRILLGTDASPGSEAAADWTGALAHDLDVPVDAVHVTFLPENSMPEDDPRNPSRLIELWSKPLADHGVETAYDVVTADHVAEALLDAAHRSSAELVVVGARASRLPFHPRLGGATMQLVHQSTDLPVVLVPPSR